MASKTRSFRFKLFLAFLTVAFTILQPRPAEAKIPFVVDPSNSKIALQANDLIRSEIPSGMENLWRRLPSNRDHNQSAIGDETRLLTDLIEFAAQLENGEAQTLRGVFIHDQFSLPILQQNGQGAGYVSSVDGALTQFGLADQFGNVGLLAHNYLSGRLFFGLEPGQLVFLIYGDGRLETYRISEIQQYQALSPTSPYSDFIELNSGQYLDANSLFTRVYRGDRHITFQTCIAQDGVASWGRIFIIASPEIEEES